jgi:hypothetical protein
MVRVEEAVLADARIKYADQGDVTRLARLAVTGGMSFEALFELVSMLSPRLSSAEDCAAVFAIVYYQCRALSSEAVQQMTTGMERDLVGRAALAITNRPQMPAELGPLAALVTNLPAHPMSAEGSAWRAQLQAALSPFLAEAERMIEHHPASFEPSPSVRVHGAPANAPAQAPRIDPLALVRD